MTETNDIQENLYNTLKKFNAYFLILKPIRIINKVEKETKNDLKFELIVLKNWNRCICFVSVYRVGRAVVGSVYIILSIIGDWLI